MANGADLILGYHATWIVGGIVVPLNPIAHGAELEHHLADAAVSLVVAAQGSLGEAAVRAPQASLPRPRELPGNGGPRTGGSRHVPTGPGRRSPPLHRRDDGDAEGRAPHPPEPRRHTIQFAEWYAFEPGAETSLGAIPMFHSGGMSGVMNVPLYAGATLVVLPRFAAPRWPVR
jgi:acyl-CoA synthetase (AMP-forming)/AMP-acid ligase II